MAGETSARKRRTTFRDGHAHMRARAMGLGGSDGRPLRRPSSFRRAAIARAARGAPS